MRHVLRARIDAAKSLKALFEQLELAPESKRVRASSHLARAYGGILDTPEHLLAGGGAGSENGEIVGAVDEPRGWRSAREVVSFLRSRGAKIAQLEHKVAGDWAALSSEGEGSGVESDYGPADDLVWIPPSSTVKKPL